MSTAPKIIDLINEKKGTGEVLTSLEYFPPRTEDGVKVSCNCYFLINIFHLDCHNYERLQSVISYHHFLTNVPIAFRLLIRICTIVWTECLQT